MAETSIGWTASPDGKPGYTFNCWVGCTKISRACDFCYAEGWAKRSGQVTWNGPPKRTSASYWKQPLKWNREAQESGVRRKVFCASLADVFDNQADPAWRRDLFELIRNTPNLDWLLLTKRPQNAGKMIEEATADLLFPFAWPWPNVWLGTTVEDQEEADRRIAHLRSIPAAKRFLSCEPLLEPIRPALSGIDWVICGGESGAHARPMAPAWALALRNQCLVAGVPFFMKQVGSNNRHWRNKITGKGEVMAEWPESLQLREFPR